MTAQTTTRDRRARRVERSAAESRRRNLRVSYEVLAAKTGRPRIWVWERLSEKSLVSTVMYSEVAMLRAALDELAKEREAAR